MFVSLPTDRSLFQGGVGLLMYHKVERASLATNLPDLYVSPAEFRRQMRELAASGLPCVPFGEVSAAAERSEAAYCLSFDDGYVNVFDNALPVLGQHGVRAIQFIVAGLIGRKDQWDHAIAEPPRRLMDETQIREWLAAGQEIGAHTLTHPRLTTLPPDAARAEIFDSRKLLEDRFGIRVRHFCYPYGDCNQRVRDWVEEAGYEAASTTRDGVNGPGVDPYLLNRYMAREKPAGLAGLPGRLARAWRRKHAL